MEIVSHKKSFERLHEELIQLVMNVVIDKIGNYKKDHFTLDMFRLRDNVVYRLSSLDWHLQSLCSHHEHYEAKFKKDSYDPNIFYAKTVLFFIFDDFVFNLISLYDYYANLLAYFLLSPNKQTIGWNSLAKTAKGNNNQFSKFKFSKDIWQHNHEWVMKINDFRSKVIHRNVQKGSDKQIISGTQGQDVQFKLLYSIHEKLSKKLNLKSPKHKDVGVDLLLGSIEIAEKSVSWLSQFTETIRTKETNNRTHFIKENKTEKDPTIQ
jgi:hypothetical protein